LSAYVKHSVMFWPWGQLGGWERPYLATNKR
jgi:hypothetical protein